MNILVSYNWLCDYLDTDANATELQKYLSLCGPSVETIEKRGDDTVLDIEITSNRIDTASMFGIAQEAQAILPQFGKKAHLKQNPLKTYTFDSIELSNDSEYNLSIETDEKLNPRFTAIVIKDVDIKDSPEYIKKRLNACGIKAINTVVDISNYLMLALGQPVHMFDYDKIGGGVMKLREAQKGEKMTTLDEKEIDLDDGDIVIEDGSGTIIDLCGIMGGLNSSITHETKTIVFFVQTYDKRHIRKTSMRTGQRTVAATYFEKGLDPERVEPTFVWGLSLLTELTGGTMASKLYDIYPSPMSEKKLTVSQKTIDNHIGVSIEPKQIENILTALGFGVKKDGEQYTITVPTFRLDDIEIKEDIVEEIARVYGYFNLPNNIPPMVYIPQPKEIELQFTIQRQIKLLLKHAGLNELMSYSMISRELIELFDMKPRDHLKLSNSISTEIEYLRSSLVPSLAMTMKNNEGFCDELKMFEIAKVYEKNGKDLPDEMFRLSIGTNTDFFDLKGIVELMCKDLHINEVSFEKGDHAFFTQQMQARVTDTQGEYIGMVGMLHPRYTQALEFKKPVYIAELDFEYLKTHASSVTTYIPPSQYATIKLDVNIPHDKPYAEVVATAKKTSELLVDMELLGLYDNKLNVRMYFNGKTRNITEQEAKKDLETILNRI
ncbi:phenylalanine--tRNA ligase subunit beta [Candidatus Woesebacteria bacterium]|nr:phenylalanine--tRNA ligase subunit beta [Candidatus Woesebacteria bacterium]